MSNKKKRRNDIILAALVIAIAATGLILLNIFKTEGSFVAVKIDGKETARYPLSVNTEVVIETENNGKNTLVIENGKAFVKDVQLAENKIIIKVIEGLL